VFWARKPTVGPPGSLRMRAPWEISDLTNPRTGVGVSDGVIEGVMVRDGVTVIVDVAVGGTGVEVGV